jgi:hypothetical protein
VTPSLVLTQRTDALVVPSVVLNVGQQRGQKQSRVHVVIVTVAVSYHYNMLLLDVVLTNN